MASTDTQFSDPRTDGDDVVFTVTRASDAWTFRVPPDALAVANMGSLENGDALATFRRCEQWLHEVACHYVDEGHPHDAPIVLDSATLATASDR